MKVNSCYSNEGSNVLHSIDFHPLELRLATSHLEKDLEDYMLSPGIRLKFEKFSRILEDLQRTTTWVQMFRWRRAMTIVMNLLRNILNYFYFKIET